MPSSVVADMEYLEHNATLRITYVGGRVYDYLSVPLSVYEEMVAAPSKGTFLNYRIKGNYKYRKVRERS
jgi:hypothetical protein